MEKITVLGSGGWGTALALCSYAKGFQVKMWTPFQKECDELNKVREQIKLLPGIKIPDDIEITTDIKCVENSFATIIAVPSFAVKETAEKLSKEKDYGIVISVSKGFEQASHNRFSEVISEVMPGADIVVLSGPSHAEEVARGVPTSVVAASSNSEASFKVQQALISNTFRIYTNDDVIGVELGGALKNIIAVAAGIVDGLKLGDNTKAALITRGIAEMSRLGRTLGGQLPTFLGLSGVGDLIVTCGSVHSRNHRFGEMVGKGVPVKEALEAVGTVEGYFASEIAKELSTEKKVELPIIDECYKIMYEGLDPKTALLNLMSRSGKSENEYLEEK